MKKENLKELLLRSVTEDISDRERRLIEDEAIYDYSFSNDFRERIMTRLKPVRTRIFSGIDFLRSFDIVFKRIAIAGITVIIILVINLLLSQGSLSYDTLLGLDTNVDEGLLSFLIE
ncbi:MAG: hypothetical protein K8R35_06850 [Bacteroidales bacterium]|nr:hypothetical protein [Bacteroidales bacterium]